MKRVLLLCSILIASLQFSQVWSAEHPAEHPKGKGGSALTKNDMAKAISAYVKEDSALKGGFFLVYDSMAKKPLVLTLKRVHKDRLSKVGRGVYFACADFKTPEGKVYDLDVFMKGPDKDHLQITEITVHKEDGKERYTWFESRGVWQKKPVTAAGKKGAEQSAEHPR